MSKELLICPRFLYQVSWQAECRCMGEGAQFRGRESRGSGQAGSGHDLGLPGVASRWL